MCRLGMLCIHIHMYVHITCSIVDIVYSWSRHSNKPSKHPCFVSTFSAYSSFCIVSKEYLFFFLSHFVHFLLFFIFSMLCASQRLSTTVEATLALRILPTRSKFHRVASHCYIHLLSFSFPTLFYFIYFFSLLRFLFLKLLLIFIRFFFLLICVRWNEMKWNYKINK